MSGSEGQGSMARSDKRRLLAAVAGASVASLVLACNGLLGLSDYTRGDCSGGACEDAGDFDVVDAPDSEPPSPTVDASGTKAVRWAQFVMPNYAQDGGPDVNVPTYDPAIGGGLVDSVSKLVWLEPMPDSASGPRSWAEAQQLCAGLSRGDVAWRLPSRIELVTLLDLDPSKGKKIDAVFRTAQGIQYWTASEVRPDVGGVRKHWTVDFSSGGLGQQDVATGQAGVRCIRDR